jgi:hypothetical protein
MRSRPVLRATRPRVPSSGVLPLRTLLAILTLLTAAQAGAQKARPAKRDTTAVPAAIGPSGSMSVVRGTKLFASPSGDTVGGVMQGAIVQSLAREREWVRVRVEGWVRERDLSPADSTFATGLTAADLRADPAGTRGKVVRWEVQVLSLQTADPLRHDMARDEPYLLARGPGNEGGLLYLTIPPALLAEAKIIPPLTMVVITARVRTGRSEPVGTPILDLRTISKR